MKVLGLDLALGTTGYAQPAGVGTLKPPDGRNRGVDRLIWIRDRVLELAQDVDLVVMEGYSYGSPTKKGGFARAHSTGELGGVVRVALSEVLVVKWVEVPPASLKLYATGKGNASKPAVLTAAVRRLGYEGHDDNESDALWLWHMAFDHYGEAKVRLPATHRKALENIAWPNGRYFGSEAAPPVEAEPSLFHNPEGD